MTPGRPDLRHGARLVRRPFEVRVRVRDHDLQVLRRPATVRSAPLPSCAALPGTNYRGAGGPYRPQNPDRKAVRCSISRQSRKSPPYCCSLPRCSCSSPPGGGDCRQVERRDRRPGVPAPQAAPGSRLETTPHQDRPQGARLLRSQRGGRYRHYAAQRGSRCDTRLDRTAPAQAVKVRPNVTLSGMRHLPLQLGPTYRSRVNPGDTVDEVARLHGRW